MHDLAFAEPYPSAGTCSLANLEVATEISLTELKDAACIFRRRRKSNEFVRSRAWKVSLKEATV